MCHTRRKLRLKSLQKRFPQCPPSSLLSGYILKYDIYLVYIHVTHYMTYIWYIPLTFVAGVQCNPYHLLWEGHLWKGTYLITKNITFFIEPFQIKKDYKDSNLIHIQLLGYYHPKVTMAKTGYNRPQCIRNQTVFKCGSLPPGTPRHPRPSGVHGGCKSLWQMLLDGQPLLKLEFELWKYSRDSNSFFCFCT